MLRLRHFTMVRWELTCQLPRARRNPETWYTKLSPVTRGSGAKDCWSLCPEKSVLSGPVTFWLLGRRLRDCQAQRSLVTPPISQESLYVRKGPSHWISKLRRRPVKGQKCSAHPLWPEIWNGQEGRWQSVLNSVGSNHLLVGVQFSSVAQSCLTLCDPMNRSTPGLPVHHQLPEFTQTHVCRVGDAISNQQSIFFRKNPEEEAHTCLAWVVTIVSYPCLWLFDCLLKTWPASHGSFLSLVTSFLYDCSL